MNDENNHFEIQLCAGSRRFFLVAVKSFSLKDVSKPKVFLHINCTNPIHAVDKNLDGVCLRSCALDDAFCSKQREERSCEILGIGAWSGNENCMYSERRNSSIKASYYIEPFTPLFLTQNLFSVIPLVFSF